MMKAVTIHEHGGPEVVRVEEIADPEATASEVLVKVKAAALNHLDIWVRKGRPGQEIKGVRVLGSDASGVITEIGPKVSKYKIGQEVIINPGLSCGECEACLAGEQSECLSYGILGLSRDGTFAQKVSVPEDSIYPKPKHLSFEEAAALPLAHLTAWRMLVSKAKIRADEIILIHGIGGGVALAALQISKIKGAKAIVTSSSEEKLERARQLGAIHAINYKTAKNIVKSVFDITGGRGVDIVFDSCGGQTMPVSIEACRKAGRIVNCGVTTGPIAQINIQAIYWKQITIFGSTMGSQTEFRQMIDAVQESKLKPVIDSVWPLEKAKDAITKMENGKQFGKIVLTL